MWGRYRGDISTWSMAQGMRQGTLVSPPKMCGKEEEKDGAACNRMCRGLQPYAAQAATVCGAGCRGVWRQQNKGGACTAGKAIAGPSPRPSPRPNPSPSPSPNPRPRPNPSPNPSPTPSVGRPTLTLHPSPSPSPSPTLACTAGKACLPMLTEI